MFRGSVPMALFEEVMSAINLNWSSITLPFNLQQFNIDRVEKKGKGKKIDSDNRTLILGVIIFYEYVWTDKVHEAKIGSNYIPRKKL